MSVEGLGDSGSLLVCERDDFGPSSEAVDHGQTVAEAV